MSLTMMLEKPITLQLKNVLYIPGINARLLSTKRLSKEHGIGVHLSPSEDYLTQRSNIIGHITQKKGQYVIKCMTTKEKASIALAWYANLKLPSKAQPLSVWHRRLCHLGIRNVIKLARQAEGVNISHDSQDKTPAACEHCANGKGHKQEYATKQLPSRAEEIGERMHTDLKEVNFGTPEQYFMIIVDDHSRYTWAFPLKRKSDATETYKNFEKWLYTQFGKPIKKLRCDNGGEYFSGQFQTYVVSRGTDIEASVAYAHEQNGMAERHIRTIFERVLAVLSDTKLPKRLWMEILETVIYVKNRSPVRPLGSKTPYEVLYGKKPDLSNLRIPGCIAYAIIPKEKRGKSDNHAARARYLGPEASNQHRLYEESSGRVIFARDVVFDEDAVIDAVPEVVEQESQARSNDAAWPEQASAANDQSAEDDTIRLYESPRDHETAEPRASGGVSRLDQSRIEPGGSTEPLASAERIAREVADRTVSSSGTSGGMSNGHAAQSRTDSTAGPENRNALAVQEEALRQTNSLGVRRSGRERFPSRRLLEALEELSPEGDKPQVYMTMLTGSLNEPRTYEEAVRSPDSPKWQGAMESEQNSHIENNSWEVIPLDQVPAGKQIIEGKWVYTIKGDGRYKARWVIKGFSQRPGFDYDETYAAVSKQTSWKMLLALAAVKGWKVRQADVVTAFLNGPIDHEIYTQLPKGFEQEGMVCRLKKSVYGLKQAPRIWWETISKKLREMGMRQLVSDPCVFTNGDVIIDIHVDDFLILSADDSKIDQVVLTLSDSFKIKDLGKASRFLGVEIGYDHQARTITLRQTKYIDDILQRFGMQDSKGKATPMLPGERLDADVAGPYLEDGDRSRYQSAVGALNYLCCMTRPDLAFTMSILSKFNQNPQEQHHLVLQRTMRYLKETRTLGITYGLERNVLGRDHLGENLYGYTDSDHAGTVVQSDSRSTGAYVFMLANGPISWSSKRQSTTAASSTEAEYIGQYEAIKESESLRMFLDEVDGMPHSEPGELYTAEPTAIYADNTAAITLATNPGMKSRAKHLRLALHWQKQIISEGRATLHQIPSKDMIADGLTKPLVKVKHEKMVKELHMTSQ